MPVIGYGTYMRKDTYEAVGGVGAAVKNAIKIGYRHIDCASFYANEIEVGKAIQDSGVPRAELFITGKVWNNCQGYDLTRRSFEKSLADLKYVSKKSISCSLNLYDGNNMLLIHTCIHFLFSLNLFFNCIFSYKVLDILISF